MKKKAVGIAITLLLLTALCLTVHFTVNPTLINKFDENPADKIAESYLAKQISLQDHALIEAHCVDPDLNGGRPCVAMTYSVRPRKNALKDWYAGNGEVGEDGWIVEKYGMITFKWIGPFAVTGLVCNTGP